MIDYHTHTERCGHATGRMHDYIAAAVARRLKEIALTDHLFLYFQSPEERSRRWAMPEEDFDTHHQEMVAARSHYANRIHVRVSVEADYVSHREEQLRRILDAYDFDFVLGGVHFLDEWMIDDVDQADGYRRERVTEIYRRYYRVLQRAAASRLFDVLAHFDLPKKFGYLPEDDLSAMIDETLDVIRESDVAIEVSTAGLRKPVREIYPSPAILRAIRHREIPIVLASDAHAPAEVAYGFDSLIPSLISMGFREIAWFDQRERRSLAFL